MTTKPKYVFVKVRPSVSEKVVSAILGKLLDNTYMVVCQADSSDVLSAVCKTIGVPITVVEGTFDRDMIDFAVFFGPSTKDKPRILVEY